MIFLTLYAAFYQLLGNLFALSALFGAIIMLFNPFGRVDRQTRQMAIGGLLAGILGQLSIIVTGTEIDKIGFFFRLSPEQISGLLMLALGMLVLRGWIRANRFQLT
jgi:hypothetical protein